MTEYTDMYIDVLRKRYAKARMMPILSWDVFSLSRTTASDRQLFDKIHLYALAKSRKWSFGIDVDKELDKPGNTIVLTDDKEQIEFATFGFTEMTGYSLHEAVGKRPGSLLQGEATSVETKEYIREQLKALKACEATLINYRKNGEPYFCNVRISPVYDDQDQHVAFVAVEREVEEPAA